MVGDIRYRQLPIRPWNGAHMDIYPGYKQGHVFTFSQLDKFIYESCDTFGIDLVYGGYQLEYLNIPCSFDIETTSFIKDGHKYACMYIWQFGMNGSVIYGRKWEEFFTLLQELDEYLELSLERRLIIYVHNLMFEFQFIRKWVEWDMVFAPKNRRPIYAIAGGFEFRCSYFLSNMSLAYIGKEMLHKYPVKKLSGDLDYTLTRHSTTPLTDKELAYCINDVKVVMSYIQEKIETDGDISKIPMTNTGYVRNYCRNKCFFSDAFNDDEKKKNRFNYWALMKSLTINDESEYDQLKRAFAGGFTHASVLHSNKDIKQNVCSVDLTSSYPYAMVAQYYPMSRGKFVGDIKTNKDFEYYLENYCCLFDIAFYDLKPKVSYENYIPYYKCFIKGSKVVENNQRVVSADYIVTTMTELDFDIVNRIYTYDHYLVKNMYIYEKDYLPKDLILAILDLYEDKTTLKGLLEKVVEYMVKKGMINASYGMMVTDIIRENFDYVTDWQPNFKSPVSQLANYNKNKNRFLFYPWGIWVTAHARHNIWQAIREFKEDYIYCDTDSIKGLNFEKHKNFFDYYNSQVRLSLLDVCNEYNIPFTKCCPVTRKGEKKLLGAFEIETGYIRFKTCGSKRYLYTYPNGYTTFTVSGLKKSIAVPYLIAKNNDIELDSEEFKKILAAYSGENDEAKKWLLEQDYDYDLIYDEFGDGMFLPPEYSGKMEASYNDKEIMGVLVDYTGKTGFYHEKSSLHISKSHYYMSMAETYKKFIRGTQIMETI